MRFHVLSLPHTQMTKDYISCAYTMKALNFSKMMMSLDHEVYAYAGDEIDAEITELVEIYSKDDQHRWFGEFDYHQKFYPITWGGTEPHWTESNDRAIEEIRKRIQPGDFICVIAGWCQKAIADAFPDNKTVEYGIGYTGIFSPFKVFESYSHMHHVYGLGNTDDGGFFDAVIPNYFDPADFPFSPDTEREDYYAFLGRYIQRKGPWIAAEAVQELGSKLIMAGQGCEEKDGQFIGQDMTLEGDHLSHIGHVNVAQRAELLSKAQATFVTTTYLEPFGGVSVESLLFGTPVITTDFGAFTEIIKHGFNGYRIRTVGEAIQAAKNLDKLASPQEIRDAAMKNYSLDAVRYSYDSYFDQLSHLEDGQVYTRWAGPLDRYTKA